MRQDLRLSGVSEKQLCCDCTVLLYCTIVLYYCTVLLYCTIVLYYCAVLLYCTIVLYVIFDFGGTIIVRTEKSQPRSKYIYVIYNKYGNNIGC